jgi:hypothetical protein
VVSDLVFGKRLPGAVYLLDGPGFPIPVELATVLAKLREKLAIGPECNVLKLSTDRLRISFLSYPEFFLRIVRGVIGFGSHLFDQGSEGSLPYQDIETVLIIPVRVSRN